MTSACGVTCSDCPAYHAAAKGRAHQRRTAEAWRRIYHLKARTEDISCGGCLALEGAQAGWDGVPQLARLRTS